MLGLFTMHTQHLPTIYKPSPADYPEITNVWEASVRATHHFLPESDIQYFKPLVQNEFLQMVDLYCTRNDADQITGFLGVAHGKVEMLFIHPDQRGKGLGKQLLQFAVSQLNATQLDVNEQNEQAVQFYRHMGFRQVARSEVDAMGKPYPILHLELA